MALHERRALGLLLALSALFSFAAPTQGTLAAEPATPSFTIQMLDAEGHPESRAGAHPDKLLIAFSLNEEGASVRDLEIELPPGLGGSSSAVPLCPRSVYESEDECPPESQVGRLEVAVSGGSSLTLPLFQVEPRPGEVLAIGSKPSVSVPLTAKVRPDDFGITLTGEELPPGAIGEGEMELWGVPADHQAGTSIPRRPFLTMPTTCGPVVFGFRIRTWAEGAQQISSSGDTGAALGGCEELSFEPELGFSLSAPVADAPTGLALELNVPGEAEGSERAPAEAKSATVEFPVGVGISPGGAEGLVACTDAQLGLGNGGPAHCPEQAKIGSAELVSDALGGPLAGAIYMGAERPGERVRSFLVVPGPGITFKFVSTVRGDPANGRLSTVMEDLPQVPVRRIGLSFDGGPRALFASPLSCGRASASATFEPYGGGPPVESSVPLTIAPATRGAGCSAPPFSPELLFESSSHRAGQPTTISTTLRRRAGEQLPRAFSTTLPAGLSAELGQVQPCTSAAATIASCPLGSRVGSATAAIGSGPSPAVLHGDAYLTGPYGHAPFGLLTRFSGRVGPLDLGTIATRSALELNRRTGRLTVSTAGIPDRVDGFPVRFQSIGLQMDRPGFVRNPTSCAAKATEASLESQSGAVATSVGSLELHGCGRLGFKPRIRLALVGRSELREHGTPALRVATRLRRRDAGLRSMRLTLPPLLKLGTGGLKVLCSRPDAEKGRCPADARVGSAQARTPLLSTPLRGGIYMAQPRGDGLPDMWIALAGSGLRIDLKSSSARVRGGSYVTRLSGLPDTPLSTFTMRLGGDSQIISLRADPCAPTEARRAVSRIAAVGQNGSRRSFRARIVADCPVPRR